MTTPPSSTARLTRTTDSRLVFDVATPHGRGEVRASLEGSHPLWCVIDDVDVPGPQEPWLRAIQSVLRALLPGVRLAVCVRLVDADELARRLPQAIAGLDPELPLHTASRLVARARELRHGPMGHRLAAVAGGGLVRGTSLGPLAWDAVAHELARLGFHLEGVCGGRAVWARSAPLRDMAPALLVHEPTWQLLHEAFMRTPEPLMRNHAEA